jgi:hypothetical protein
MYRIPQNLDLSKAIGQFTTQICVGKYDIQFNLGDVHFAVQSTILLTKNGKIIAKWSEGIWPENGFIEIFNVNVSKITIPDNKSIIILFENNIEMHLKDDSDQYECMQISINGDPKEWII